MLFHWFEYNTLVCCRGFHGNISVKVRITRKWFDLCTEILVAYMAIHYALTVYRLNCKVVIADVQCSPVLSDFSV